jgi:hypothetical protein
MECPLQFKRRVAFYIQRRTSMKRLTSLALLGLAACGGQGTGKISLMLTDAPGDFKAAVVTITQINLVGSGGETTLSNDVSALVHDAVVEAGTYTELDFVISGGYIEVANSVGGTTIFASSPTYEGLPPGAIVGGTLKMPSFRTSGLKVSLPDGHVTVGTESKVLLVDFDVQQSFGHEAGGSGSWVMHPVMTATDFLLSGNLSVTLKLGSGVTLPTGLTLGSFDSVLTNSGGSAKRLQLSATSIGSSTFGATFKYLIPGSYTLGFALDPSVTGTVSITTSPAIPAIVAVNSGAATQSDFTMTSAQ